jgi:hypothetical protein
MEKEVLAGQLAELLALALVPAIGWALAALRRWHINGIVLKAIARGAGAAYMTLLETRDGITPQAIDWAVGEGAAYVEKRVPGTLPKAGFVSTSDVREAVRAHLGTLLPADPSVRIGGQS